MSNSVAEIFARLRPDPWRAEVGFSPEVSDCQSALFAMPEKQERWELALGNWLQKYQPCLFGRVAAKLGLITYCFLTESDLLAQDEAIQKKIQDARRTWTREGFEGKRSGFVILVLSPKIANSEPSRDLELLARRICSLYLLREIDSDRIYGDSPEALLLNVLAVSWSYPE